MKNKRIYSFLAKLDRCLEKAESIFSMICMAGVVIAVLAGVAMRFIFRISTFDRQGETRLKAG